MKDPEHGEFSFGKSIILSIGALTFRGWSSTPMKTSARIIFFMYVKVTQIRIILIAKIFLIIRTVFLGGFLNWSFMADVISQLMTRVTVLPFTDIQTLLQNTDYLISVFPDSTQENRFKLSSDPFDQKAYAERIKPYLDDFEESYQSKFDNSWVKVFSFLGV